MKHFCVRITLLFIVFFAISSVYFQQQALSAPATNLKDQMSNAQLSFFGRLDAGNSTGSIIKILTSGTVPSITTDNLFSGDTIAISADANTSTIYTVTDIGNSASIELNTAVAVGNTAPGAYIVATRSAIHVVSFIPQTATPNEIWRVLFKATSRAGETENDGMPDQAGFDLGADVGSTTTGLGTRLKAADIQCPMGATASVGSTIITTGVSLGSTGPYNYIQCLGTGSTMNTGVGISIGIGRDLSVGSQLINPSASNNGHVPGTAGGANNVDVYTLILQQMDSSFNLLESTLGKVAVTESVRVTAIVDPTITFIIDNVGTTNPGATVCSSQLGSGAANTTATSVPFGPLTLGTYNNLAQRFSCITNSQNGYVIQAYESKNLTMIGTNTTIPDTNCEGSSCTTSSAGVWTGFTNSGFGYSLEVGSTSAGAVLGIDSNGQYKPFGLGTANAQTLMSRTNTPAGTDSAYICYRVTASNYQPAGSYENSISFIATATF